MGASKSIILVDTSFSVVSNLNACSGKRGVKLTKLIIPLFFSGAKSLIVSIMEVILIAWRW